MGTLMRQALRQVKSLSTSPLFFEPVVMMRPKISITAATGISQKRRIFTDTTKLDSRSSGTSSYEGDGKTTVTILNTEVDAWLMVDAYHQNGFRLNNGMTVMGPMAIFSNTVLGWDVGKAEDVTPESVSLFAVMEPKISLLMIGLGDPGEKLPIETTAYLKKNNINIEVSSTDNACKTYNFMISEKRNVAAILIPPRRIEYSPDTYVHSKLARDRLYADDNT